ncbi:hypothetical protein LIER_28635 [Lithospermum erythrorhizon]|uniref:F-box/kelch-repeat protein n=1 Tax=Lithospermum erythrorhizon TaxID=34254 RepID=A0AAV3RJR9_LITER
MDTRNPDAGACAFVLGNTLWVLGGTLVERHPFGEVLDLDTGNWKFLKASLKTRVWSLIRERYIWACSDAFPPTGTEACRLLHLGNGLLCIVWANSESSSTILLLHCTKFTVIFENYTNSGQLSDVADVNFTQTYKLPPGRMEDCVAV